MERLEFQQDEGAQDGKAGDETQDEVKHEDKSAQNILKGGIEQANVADMRQRPARAGLQYELI